MQPPDPNPGEHIKIWPETGYESFEAGQQKNQRQCCTVVAGCSLLLVLMYSLALFLYHLWRGKG